MWPVAFFGRAHDCINNRAPAKITDMITGTYAGDGILPKASKTPNAPIAPKVPRQRPLPTLGRKCQKATLPPLSFKMIKGATTAVKK